MLNMDRRPWPLACGGGVHWLSRGIYPLLVYRKTLRLDTAWQARTASRRRSHLGQPGPPPIIPSRREDVNSLLVLGTGTARICQKPVYCASLPGALAPVLDMVTAFEVHLRWSRRVGPSHEVYLSCILDKCEVFCCDVRRSVLPAPTAPSFGAGTSKRRIRRCGRCDRNRPLTQRGAEPPCSGEFAVASRCPPTAEDSHITALTMESWIVAVWAYGDSSHGPFLLLVPASRGTGKTNWQLAGSKDLGQQANRIGDRTLAGPWNPIRQAATFA